MAFSFKRFDVVERNLGSFMLKLRIILSWKFVLGFMDVEDRSVFFENVKYYGVL